MNSYDADEAALASAPLADASEGAARQIAYFISAHGLGHTTRACAVMAAAQAREPTLHFHIFTEAPEWIFRESLIGPYTYHRATTDIGLVQITPLVEDLDATLERLAMLGFRRVEPYDLLGFRASLRDGLRRHELAAPTAHVELLDADLEAVFDAAAELGITTVIQPWTEPARWQSEAGVQAVAAELNAVATRAAARGIRVGYHNHHFELASLLDGRHALEVFADLLVADAVLEVDTYWAHAGGADVPALLQRLGERVVARGGMLPARAMTRWIVRLFNPSAAATLRIPSPDATRRRISSCSLAVTQRIPRLPAIGRLLRHEIVSPEGDVALVS